MLTAFLHPRVPALLISIATMLAVAPLAHAATAMPSYGFGDIVVDDAHGHVFVSGSPDVPTGDVVSAFNFDGSAAGPITGGGSGTGGMAISGNYLYVQDGGAIDKIDLTTMERVAFIPLTYPIGEPYDLELAGGRLWYSQSAGYIASVTLDDTHTNEQFAVGSFGTPHLARATTATDNLVTMDTMGTPPGVQVWNVATGTPVLVHDNWNLDGTVTKIAKPDGAALSADGNSLLGDSLMRGGIQAFPLGGPATGPMFATGGISNAAAPSADGAAVAVGAFNPYDADVRVYTNSDFPELKHNIDFGANAALYPGALAMSADHVHTFAVYSDEFRSNSANFVSFETPLDVATIDLSNSATNTDTSGGNTSDTVPTGLEPNGSGHETRAAAAPSTCSASSLNIAARYGSLKVRWSAAGNDPTPTGYRIIVQRVGGAVTRKLTVSAHTQTTTLSRMRVGQKFVIRIRTMSASGMSASSCQVRARIHA